MSKKYSFRDVQGNPYPESKEALLSDFATKITTKNLDFSIKNVISNSAKRGLISQRDYFDKQIANDKNINSYYIIEKGNFVYNPRISSDSPYGPVNIYKLPEKGIVSPLYLCFSTTGINLDYLEWFFKSDSWFRHLYLNGDTGARHDRVSIKDFNFLSMPISIPSLAEQVKIAEFFSALDERIALTADKVKLLKEQKVGYLQKVFAQELVFTDDNGNRYPEWEQKKLGEVGEFIRGLTYSSSDTSEAGSLVLRSNNIQDGFIDLAAKELQFVSKSIPEKQKLKKGDIAICMANGSKRLVGKSALYAGSSFEEVTVGAFCSIFKSENLLARYLFQTETYKKYLRIFLGGAGINNLKNSDLEGVPISLPSDVIEQEKIAKFFSVLDEQIELTEKKLALLKEQKKGYLQGIFG